MNIFSKVQLLNSRLWSTGFRIRFNSIKHQPKESGAHMLLLSIPVAAFCLGTWQVKRLSWKKNLIRDLESRTLCDPVPLPKDILLPETLKEMEYKRVTVVGTFDYDEEIMLGPRPKKESGKKNGGLISRPSNIGFHVITPFVLDLKERILINRGWVSKNQLNPEERKKGQITNQVKLTAYVRKGEKRPQFTPKVQEGALSWHYCDVESFSQILNTLPLLLDVDESCTVPDGPIGGQTLVTLRNEHLQYIITWYALCFSTLVMYYYFRKNPTSALRANSDIKSHYSKVKI